MTVIVKVGIIPRVTPAGHGSRSLGMCSLNPPIREGDFCRRIATMRAARDLILVVCAVISTVCLVYIAINLNSIWADSTTSETAAAPDAER